MFHQFCIFVYKLKIIMEFLRQILSPFNGQISIEIPKTYTQKRFEVIVLPIDENTEKISIQSQMALFLSSLPKREPEISEEEIMSEVKAVRIKRYGK
jgi:hypothetical protein